MKKLIRIFTCHLALLLAISATCFAYGYDSSERADTSFTYHEWGYQLVSAGLTSLELQVWLDGTYTVDSTTNKIIRTSQPTIWADPAYEYYPSYVTNLSTTASISSNGQSVTYSAYYDVYISFETFDFFGGRYHITGIGYSNGTSSDPVCTLITPAEWRLERMYKQAQHVSY